MKIATMSMIVLLLHLMDRDSCTNWLYLFQSIFYTSLRKHIYSNILKILQSKTEFFQIKKSDIFHISAQNRLWVLVREIFFSGTKGPMALELDMQHWGYWPSEV